jgi:hypothetical protein
MQWLKSNYHLLLANCWLVLAIPAVLWWKQSVLFVILLSLYANWEASMSAHNAKKARDENEGQ